MDNTSRSVVTRSMDKKMEVNKRILYTKLAKYYDYLVPSTTKEECDFLDEIFNKFGENKIFKILDLGCGTGRHASLLQQMGYQVTGIDLSTQMLKVAKEKSPQSTFIKMDFCSPKFENDFFDASICMWSTIGYILDKDEFRKFVRNVSRATREILILSSTNHERGNFQTDEITERVTLIPSGKITTKIMRHYDSKTEIREENYKYSIIENGKLVKLIDRNKLRLWKIREIENLLLPEFKILNVYGDYSINDIFNINNSDKKIIVAKKSIV